VLTTTAAVMTQVGQPLELAEVDLLEPQYGEVRVRMLTSGVCRSDLSTINGAWPLPLPAVLGHEGAALIDGVGPGVDPGRVGETVVLTFAPNCGTCRFCNEGRVNLCKTGFASFDKGSMADGTTRLRWRGESLHHLQYLSSFAHAAVVPQRAAIRVPEGIDPIQLCLLGCGITTGVLSVTKRAGVRPGESVAIYGCGGVGLAAVMGAKLISAYPIIAIDPIEQKRTMARRVGATHTIDPKASDPVTEIRKVEPEGVDYAFEVIGRTEVARQSFESIAVGGVVVCVGQPAIGVDYAFPAFDMAQYQPTILGSNLGGASPAVDIPRLARLVQAQILDLEPLITHRFRLDEINEAIAVLETGTAGRIVLDYR
jgi:S-(hydroxymethyl)glutathione dehydrogenase / alcohol dehydrogenase